MLLPSKSRLTVSPAAGTVPPESDTRDRVTPSTARVGSAPPLSRRPGHGRTKGGAGHGGSQARVPQLLEPPP